MRDIIDYLDFLECLEVIKGWLILDNGVAIVYKLDAKYIERTIYFDVENGDKYTLFEALLEEMIKIKDEKERELFSDIIVLCRVRLINELQKKIDNIEEHLKVCGFDKELSFILDYDKEALNYLNKSGELDLPLKYKDIGKML